MVVCYVDPDSQGWLLEQLPPMIQQQLQKYIHIVGVIFLGVAVSLVLMFALGIEILYFKSRGIGEEQAISMILNGFCKEVFNQLPLEFAVEAVKLLEMKLEDSVG